MLIKNPTISIVIPVYNTESYLERCIESVVSQSYKKFELLLIDDGSDDNSGYICDKYSSLDPRIKSFHTKNKGVSVARNYGLDLLKGEVVTFVDSDDCVGENYLLELIESYNRLETSGMVIHNILINDQKCPNEKLPELIINNKKEELINVFISEKLRRFSRPSSKLFSTDVIKKYSLRFPAGVHMGEDAIFNVLYLSRVDSLILSNKSSYFLTRRGDSLVTRYNSFKSEYLGYNLLKKAVRQFFNTAQAYTCDYQKKVWKNTENLFIRTVQSVYKSNHYSSLSEQVACLEIIDSDDFRIFGLYYQPNLIRRKICKFLLLNKLFYLYCICGRISTIFIKK
jgi:glycosyltransferase involved in cell wall biosynthesis